MTKPPMQAMPCATPDVVPVLLVALIMLVTLIGFIIALLPKVLDWIEAK